MLGVTINRSGMALFRLTLNFIVPDDEDGGNEDEDEDEDEDALFFGP